jgi:NAD(P)-dependent dehydrogenase (short-subunit alcohol dehydrogenase family)
MREALRDPDMRGRAAIVTGAARGIGAAIAMALGARGVRLLLLDVKAEPLRDLAREIERKGGEASVLLGDVRDWDQVETAATDVSGALRECGHLHRQRGTRRGRRFHDR